MKQIFAFAGFLIFLILSCTEETEDRPRTLIVTGISGAKGSEIVCVDIDSGAVVNTTPIECFVFGSTVYDPGTHGYGFVDCDTSFKLINPESGELIKSIRLPGFVSQAVIDTKDNLLIGRYTTIDYEDDPDTTGVKSDSSGPPIYTNYVVTVNLSTGAIISKNKINLGGGAYATTYYYDEKGKHYILYRSDNYLITINPLTGEIIKEQYVGKILVNSVYNPADNTLISLSYPAPGDQRIYLMVIDPETGAEISSRLIASEEGYYANIAGYDKDNNWYIAVNSKFEVVCFDVSTGDVKKRYKLENPLTDMKFWRR
jgi:outer membrane protein assembly factor BamB